jgi:hypothetical protein
VAVLPAVVSRFMQQTCVRFPERKQGFFPLRHDWTVFKSKAIRMVRIIIEERLSASVFLQKSLASKTGVVSYLEKGLVGGTDAGQIAEP